MSRPELDLREFGDWPLAHRAAACAMLALIACALPWLLLTRHAVAESQALGAAGRALQTQLMEAERQANALPPVLPDAPPDTDTIAAPDLSQLMTALADAAHAAGLQGGRWRPQPATSIDADASPSIELRVAGTWPQLHRFASALAAPGWQAGLSLRDIHLRAQTATPLLELSATVAIYLQAASDVPVWLPSGSSAPTRNPFADTRTHPQRLVGSLHNGREQVGLRLDADGQLRRASPTTRKQP